MLEKRAPQRGGHGVTKRFSFSYLPSLFCHHPLQNFFVVRPWYGLKGGYLTGGIPIFSYLFGITFRMAYMAITPSFHTIDFYLYLRMLS
jgi:hypothetical protein